MKRDFWFWVGYCAGCPIWLHLWLDSIRFYLFHLLPLDLRIAREFVRGLSLRFAKFSMGLT